MNSNVNLISHLLHSRTQAHIYHFRTKSFAQHKALEQYYTGIVALLDNYTEAYQGTYGIMSGYKSFQLLQDPNTSISYFTKLLSEIKKTEVLDSYLKNILDTIYELVYKTLYLLKNLS